MSLSEIRNPSAETNPINTFFVYEINSGSSNVGSEIISGLNPSLTVFNTAGNANRANVYLQGGPSIQPVKIQSDNGGNAIIETFQAGSNISLLPVNNLLIDAANVIVGGTTPVLTVSGPTATLFLTAASPQRPVLVLTSGSFSPVVLFQNSSTGDAELQNQNANSNIDLLTTGTGTVLVNGNQSLYATDGAVTQLTSITTPVTYNGISCRISTATFSIAALGSASFTFNNSFINTTSVVIVNSNGSSGFGVPVLATNSVVSGSCVIRIDNVSATNTVVSPMNISVLVC
jgi:hypothetical protein